MTEDDDRCAVDVEASGHVGQVLGGAGCRPLFGVGLERGVVDAHAQLLQEVGAEVATDGGGGRADQAIGDAAEVPAVPANIAGTELSTPRPTRRAAALRPSRPPTKSSMKALVQNPMGRSVSIGCRG